MQTCPPAHTLQPLNDAFLWQPWYTCLLVVLSDFGGRTAWNKTWYQSPEVWSSKVNFGQENVVSLTWTNGNMHWYTSNWWSIVSMVCCPDICIWHQPIHLNQIWSQFSLAWGLCGVCMLWNYYMFFFGQTKLFVIYGEGFLCQSLDSSRSFVLVLLCVF